MRFMAVLTLAALGAGCSTSSSDVRNEIGRRNEYAYALSVDAGSTSSWNVCATNDIRYVDGFSPLSHDPPTNFRNHAFRWMGQRGYVRLRTHGDRAMKLFIGGWVNEEVTRNRPVVAAYIDGQRVGATDEAIGPDGLWGIDTRVPESMLRDRNWVDLTIVVSAVAFHWGEPPGLQVVVLTALGWTEAP